MAVIFGTDNGVWELTDGQYKCVGLAGKKVSHVATREGRTLATVPHDGLYTIAEAGERLIWQGDARSCAVAPDGAFYVGTEPAMVLRSDDAGETWRRSDKIDGLPTRGDWCFPPAPHQPHVRSIDFLPGKPETILAGVEVGGVLFSTDRGETWEELNNGVYEDVHTLRPDPSQPGRLVAVTGKGFYASEDGGDSWEKRMEGLGHSYTVGLHVNPARAGELLIAAGEAPPGINGYIYHSLDAGRSWEEVLDPALPKEHDIVPVVFFADDAAWVATHRGQIFRAEDVKGSWSLVCELPAAINAADAGGSPSSVDSGYRA